MVNKKRYQIFVSSTFADLKEERKMVMQAILERKGFPAGMELFPAKDKRQFDYIKQVIDDSDYYLLIIGARYGSLDDDGVSYTEKEYDYAVSKEIPVIAFLHSDIKSIPLGKADDDKELRLKLEAFRAKVQTGRLVNYWENAHDLKAKVISSLVDAFEDQPRIGWVRSDSVVNGNLQKEMDRLKKEISLNQSEIERLTNETVDYYAFKSMYQDSQIEIEILNEQIKNLNSELKKLKKTNPQKIIIPGTEVSFNMIFVEGGTFMMGANDDNNEKATDDERPAHEVTLSDYWIGETQVTYELWQALMGKKSIRWFEFVKEHNLPVVCICWFDCQKFIERLNEMTSKNFHLPTEAQWEYAARGGIIGKENGERYAGRNDNLEAVAWYYKNSSGMPHPVARLRPNQLGIYDMSGNVMEWCQDWYDSNYYNNSPKYEPKGPSSGLYNDRVCRGGSWMDIEKYCRVTKRFHYSGNYTNSNLGLRLAL